MKADNVTGVNEQHGGGVLPDPPERQASRLRLVGRPGETRRFRLPGFWMGVSAALIVHAGLAVDCARRWTPTHDEYWHLPLGLYAWNTGDARADPINPPLLRLWAALPLWLTGTELGPVEFPAANAYAVGDAFLKQHGEHHRERFLLGRLMILPWGLAGAVIVASWARRWWGDAAGLVAAGLWCGCPLLLAHSALVAHDLPATTATLAVLDAIERLRSRPTTTTYFLWTSAFIGSLIGIACLTKLSAIALLVIAPAFWMALPSDRAPSWTWQLRGLLVAGVCWLIVLHLGYAADTCSGRPWPPMGLFTAWLPSGFVAGMEALRQVLNVPHPVYLDGAWRLGGFRQYYLRGLLDQMPLGLFALGALATRVGMGQWRERRAWRRFLAVAVVIVAVLIPASFSGNQLGLRYVMPVIPFGILLCASAAQPWDRASRSWRVAIVLCMTATLSALRFHPHQLSFFNAASGGPEQGWTHMVDSNIDWGQDLHSLRDWLRAHPSGEPLHLAYFGTVSPSSLGITYRFPPAREPRPGRFAFSVNYVAGRPHHMRDINGQELSANIDDFGYCRYFTPTARIGYSIHVYELTPEDVARYQMARTAASR